MANKVSGTIELKVDGETYLAKGSFTYGLGKPTRETILGSDKVHGFKEMPSTPFIEGDITDDGTFSLDKFGNITDSTVTLGLGNGKIMVLRNAWTTNKDGLSGQTEDGNLSIRFEGRSMEEVR